MAIIWATTNGYVDEIAVDDVAAFNDGFRQALRAEQSILAGIRDSLDLSDDSIAKLEKAVQDFAKGFQGSAVTAGASP